MNHKKSGSFREKVEKKLTRGKVWTRVIRIYMCVYVCVCVYVD